MPQTARTPVWPLLGVVVGLFVLSLFAPKAWQSLKTPPLAPMRGTRVVAAAIPSANPGRPAANERRQTIGAEIRRRPSVGHVQAPELTEEGAASASDETAGESAPPEISDEPPPALAQNAEQEPGRSPTPAARLLSPPAFASISDESDPPAPEPAWPVPQALISQLEELTEDPAISKWAQRVRVRIELLTQLNSPTDGRAPQLFDDLRKLAGEAAHLAHGLDPLGPRVQLKRAEFAILRRVEIWEQIHAVATGSNSTTYPAIVEPGRLTESLRQIEGLMRGRTGAEDWRKYLLLDRAWQLTQTGGLSEMERRDLARQILGRLESHVLNDTQLAFFQKPEFAALAVQLRPWAYEPVDSRQLLQELERYERERRRDPARQVAEAFQSLRWSSDDEISELADKLETHYRNANLRIAVSGQLINSILPEVKPTAEGVSEQIAGANVYGRSETEARLLVRLIPDRLRLRLGLEAHGVVASETAAAKGPARFYSDDLSRYSARKQMVIDRRGMRVTRSEAEAESESYVRGMETEFDGLPIVGPIVRSIAQQKYNNMQWIAKAEVEGRVADKASQRLDDEVHKRLHEAERQFETRVLGPLNKLNLQPTPLGMETTAERLIVRYRLAGDYQLAAHTPRPQAPGDSWLSLQVHQSALNNAIEQMKFDGRQMTVHELVREVAEILGQPLPAMPEDLPADVRLKFAERDSVRVVCESGRVLLVVRLAELNAGKGSRWRNFEVRAPLVPRANGLDAELIREGTIELSGEELGLRDQIALRGIFSRVISKNKALSLVPEKIKNDPRLKDLAVQQFVIDDGWISLALSPQRTAAKRPSGKAATRRP